MNNERLLCKNFVLTEFNINLYWFIYHLNEIYTPKGEMVLKNAILKEMPEDSSLSCLKLKEEHRQGFGKQPYLIQTACRFMLRLMHFRALFGLYNAQNLSKFQKREYYVPIRGIIIMAHLS